MPSLTLTTVNVGTPDPIGLARFYERLLGWPIAHEEPGFVIVRDPAGGVGVSFQLEEGHVPPSLARSARRPADAAAPRDPRRRSRGRASVRGRVRRHGRRLPAPRRRPGLPRPSRAPVLPLAGLTRTWQEKSSSKNCQILPTARLCSVRGGATGPAGSEGNGHAVPGSSDRPVHRRQRRRRGLLGGDQRVGLGPGRPHGGRCSGA